MRTSALLWLGGAGALAGEAAVHVQQYVVIFHAVNWIGPLFLANAAACAVAIAGLGVRRMRTLAGLAGVAISATALGGLVVSYGQGLFGWQEAGFRPVIELTVIFELAAVVLLSAALAAAAASTRRGGATTRTAASAGSPPASPPTPLGVPAR